jgi:hypothetical protein
MANQQLTMFEQHVVHAVLCADQLPITNYQLPC